MILIDANLLLYAYNDHAAEHAKARRWLEGVFSGSEPVLLPWLSIYAFIRIVTNSRALAHPISTEKAVGIVGEWLALRHVSVPAPGERHWEILRNLLVESQCRGQLVTDAVLAALAIENGATLCTNDRDFSRFRKLRTFNPIA